MSKKQDVLKLMQRQWVTVHVSQRALGLNALSQRVTELRREGHNIVSRRVPGESYHEYRALDAK
jgi:hypothetical protein